MQSKSTVFVFMSLITLPIIMLSSNHEIFFGITSLILTVSSVKYFYELFLDNEIPPDASEAELEEELEELIGIDVKKLGTGLSIVYNMLIILFLCYCAFFMETLVFKAVASFAIMLQIYFIVKKSGKHPVDFRPDLYKPQLILSNILNLSMIIFTVINKLYKLK